MDSQTLGILVLCIAGIVSMSGIGMFAIHIMFKIVNKKNDD